MVFIGYQAFYFEVCPVASTTIDRMTVFVLSYYTWLDHKIAGKAQIVNTGRLRFLGWLKYQGLKKALTTMVRAIGINFSCRFCYSTTISKSVLPREPLTALTS
jgi:hypothetical protein